MAGTDFGCGDEKGCEWFRETRMESVGYQFFLDARQLRWPMKREKEGRAFSVRQKRWFRSEETEFL